MVAKKLLKNIQEMDSLEVRKLKRNVEAWLLAPTNNDCHGKAGCAASLPHRLRGVEILSMWVPAVWWQYRHLGPHHQPWQKDGALHTV